VSDETFDVTCPCCQTRLTLDSGDGSILLEERVKRPGRGWDDVVQAGADKEAAAERQFRQNMDRAQNADELLDKKFREALKRAEKTTGPAPNIFDLD
jgi:hypothetical protein